MSRRVGGGSVFRRKDGYWVGQIELGWSPTGKRERRTIFGKTQASVVEQLKALAHSKELGAVQAGKVPALGAYLEQWLEQAAKPNVRPSTFVSYSTIVNVHLVPGLGKVRLDRLTAPMVQRFPNEKRATGLSARRVQYLHAVLRRALGQAVVAAFEGHHLEGLVTVILGLGLRLGEALALQWSAVDLDHRRLRIVATLQRLPTQDGSRQWVLGEPKTRQSRRALPLPDAVAAPSRASGRGSG
jgi:integrase